MSKEQKPHEFVCKVSRLAWAELIESIPPIARAIYNSEDNVSGQAAICLYSPFHNELGENYKLLVIHDKGKQ